MQGRVLFLLTLAFTSPQVVAFCCACMTSSTASPCSKLDLRLKSCYSRNIHCHHNTVRRHAPSVLHFNTSTDLFRLAKLTADEHLTRQGRKRHKRSPCSPGSTAFWTHPHASLAGSNFNPPFDPRLSTLLPLSSFILPAVPFPTYPPLSPGDPGLGALPTAHPHAAAAPPVTKALA